MTRVARVRYASDAGLRERAVHVLASHRQDDSVAGCWLWTGCKLPTGHGMVRILGKVYLVHRLSAWLYLDLDITNRFIGSRKDASQVNHKPTCLNTNCFNPEHLYVGTQQENIHDIPDIGHKLLLSARGVCKQGHPFNPETYVKGQGCLICRRIRHNEQHMKHREKRNAYKRERRRLCQSLGLLADASTAELRAAQK